MSPRAASHRQASLIAACAVVSGVLVALSFRPTDGSLGWLIAWVALVPLGVVLSSPTMTLRSWAGVYLGGIICHLWILDWIRTLYGGTSLQGNYVSGWLISGQIGAMLFCLMVAAGRRGVRTAKMPVTIVLPLVWMSYEYLQCCVTSPFDQTGAPLVSLAYTQANNATIAQAAALGGAGLISLIIVTTNGYCYDAIIWMMAKESGRLRTRPARLALVPLALVAVFVYGQVSLNHKNSERGPRVCLMGLGDLPPLLDKNRIRGESPLTNAERDFAPPDLLVWPELAYHHALVSTEENPRNRAALNEACPLAKGEIHAYRRTVRHYLEQAAVELQAGVLIGCERVVSNEEELLRYNCLAFVDPAAGLVNHYDKRHLVPFTEFLPPYGRWLRITNRKDYAQGRMATPLILRTDTSDREFRVGCGLCYDVAFAKHFAQQQQNENIDFFVVSGSEVADATGCMSEMLLRMAQIRAIETRRPIIRNTHLGFSGLIDANGRYLGRDNREAIIDPWLLNAVPLDTRVSLYSQMGDWLSPTCFGVLLCLLIKPKLRVVRFFAHRSRQISQQELSPAIPMRLATTRRQAFSLLELLAVVTIIGTISVLIIPRVSASAEAAKEASDGLNRAQINASVEQWYLEKGVWPANDLSDLAADADYFPEGIPTNPVNGLAYSLNATTHRVIVTGGGGGGK